MERRKFLIGAGSLAAGAAAATGTGAFTSVSADRTLSAEIVGDRSGALTFTRARNDEDGQVTPNSSEYVEFSTDGTGDPANDQTHEIEFDFDNLNDDATFIFDDLFDIKNAGTQEVKVNADVPDGVSIYAENGPGAADNRSLNDDYSGTGQPVNGQIIGVGEAAEDVGIAFYDTDKVEDLPNGTITFAATATGDGQDDGGSS